MVFLLMLISLSVLFAVCFLVDVARNGKNMNFSSAYLLPIPVVDADIDFDDLEYMRLLNENPTVFANHTSSIGIPVAEPTEGTPLIFR
jgi:hypothetical protein